MNKNLLFILIIMGVGSVFSFHGCKSGAVANEGELEFDYFPARNIYYNVASSKFIYSLDGAKTWDSLKVDSKDGFASLGKKEKIFTKTGEVWRENDAHLKMYEGKVFEIINVATETDVAVVDEVTDKRAILKSGSEVKKTEPAKKKGIRGFFDRVFKKKDKK